jgi:2-polyprenyl-3-methyl-5-hydroxy-6-metoxy-1,4-benzoquinol methylase
MNYKEKLYSNYVSTHIIPRKGESTLDEFKWRSIVYQKQFGKFLPKDKSSKIIDLGCGNGSVVWWLQQSGFTDAEGIDISVEQVEVAQKLGVKNIKQADIKQLLRDKKDFYDVVFGRDVIEHFGKEDIVEILSLCCDSLKKNGVIIIQAPNAESLFFGRIRYGDFTHEIAFTTGSLSQLLRMVGFARVEFYPVQPIIHGVKSFVRFILWKIVETFYKFLLFIEVGKGQKIVTQGIIAVAKKWLKAKAY